MPGSVISISIHIMSRWKMLIVFVIAKMAKVLCFFSPFTLLKWIFVVLKRTEKRKHMIRFNSRWNSYNRMPLDVKHWTKAESRQNWVTLTLSIIPFLWFLLYFIFWTYPFVYSFIPWCVDSNWMFFFHVLSFVRFSSHKNKCALKEMHRKCFV